MSQTIVLKIYFDHNYKKTKQKKNKQKKKQLIEGPSRMNFAFTVHLAAARFFYFTLNLCEINLRFLIINLISI